MIRASTSSEVFLQSNCSRIALPPYIAISPRTFRSSRYRPMIRKASSIFARSSFVPPFMAHSLCRQAYPSSLRGEYLSGGGRHPMEPGVRLRLAPERLAFVPMDRHGLADLKRHEVLPQLQGAAVGLPGLRQHVVQGRRRNLLT